MNEREKILLSQLAQLNSSATPADIQLLTSDLTSYFTEIEVERDSSVKQLNAINEKYNTAITMNGELLTRIPINSNDNINIEKKQQQVEEEIIDVKDVAKIIIEENDL